MPVYWISASMCNFCLSVIIKKKKKTRRESGGKRIIVPHGPACRQDTHRLAGSEPGTVQLGQTAGVLAVIKEIMHDCMV